MKKIRYIKKLISLLVLLTLVLTIIPNTFVQADAKTNAEKVASTYLNATKLYLHLGNKETGSFDFEIKKSKQVKGNKYNWYIHTDKGNPNSVSINALTGVVTAKEVGTAYIICKVTLSNGTILRPEARVIVVNNVTDVKISNLPKDMLIQAGQEYNFNHTILSTESGTGKKSDGITRWEIKDDTADAVKAADNGVIYPIKSGQFKIRAVSFESIEKYDLWVKDKAANIKYITASSGWNTIKVENNGVAIAKTQKQLGKVLSEKDFKEINLVTSKSELFVIKKGDFSNKSLIINAPNADVKNYATFKDITIKAIKDTTWIEYADGNIVYLSDTASRFVVDSTAHIKQIVIDTANSKVNFEVNGIVDQIKVVQPSEVTLTGNRANTPIIVEEGAMGSTISTSIPLNLELKANVDVALNKGAEDSKIDKTVASIVVKVENNSAKPVTITTNNVNGEVVDAGKIQTSDSPSIPPTTDVNIHYPPVQTVNVTGVNATNPAGTGDVTVTAVASNYGSSTATVELIGIGTPITATNVTIGLSGLISKTFLNVPDGTYTARVTVGSVDASSSQFTVAAAPQILTTLVVSTSNPTIGTTMTVTPKDVSGNTISSGITYQWYWSITNIAETAGLSGVGGVDGQWATYGSAAQSSTYTPAYPQDTNKYILIVAKQGSTFVKYKIPGQATANVSGYTHYTGAFDTSTPITVNFSGNDVSHLTYQWYYTNNTTINAFGPIGINPASNWVAITGAVTNTLTPSTSDLTHRLMIKAMGADGSYTCYAVYAPVTVTGVSVDNTTLSLTEGGEPSTLVATVAPSTATNKNVVWSSSDTSVATINGGIVTPVAAGTATISVTTEDGSKTATCVVTVNAASTVSFGSNSNGSISFVQNTNKINFSVTGGLLTDSLVTNKFIYKTSSTDSASYTLAGSYTKVSSYTLNPGEYSYMDFGNGTTYVQIALTPDDAAAIKALSGYGNTATTLNADTDYLELQDNWYVGGASGGDRNISISNLIHVVNSSSYSVSSEFSFVGNINYNSENMGGDLANPIVNTANVLVVSIADKLVFYVGTYMPNVTPTSGLQKIVTLDNNVITNGIVLDDNGWTSVDSTNFGQS